mgnify:CR=1 FL=1
MWEATHECAEYKRLPPQVPQMPSVHILECVSAWRLAARLDEPLLTGRAVGQGWGW